MAINQPNGFRMIVTFHDHVMRHSGERMRISENGVPLSDIVTHCMMTLRPSTAFSLETKCLRYRVDRISRSRRRPDSPSCGSLCSPSCFREGWRPSPASSSRSSRPSCWCGRLSGCWLPSWLGSPSSRAWPWIRTMIAQPWYDFPP